MNCQDRFYIGQDRKLVTRRWFFEQCGVGLGAIALGTLFRQSGWASPASLPNPLAPKQPHFAPKAKRIIFLFMAGAPSHLELFDYKPQLTKFDGTLPPPDLIQGYRAAFINPSSKLLGPKFKFQKHGQCGMELSELLPHIGALADDSQVRAGHIEGADKPVDVPAQRAAVGRHVGRINKYARCHDGTCSLPGASRASRQCRARADRTTLCTPAWMSRRH